MNPQPHEVVLNTARTAACLILENGGETYRAEETATRIAYYGGYDESEVIALTTGIFITIAAGGETLCSSIKRIKKRSIDLAMVDRVNKISRELASGKLDFNEAEKKLDELTHTVYHRFHRLRYCTYTALSCAFFALLYGGSLFDAGIALLCGAAVQLLSSSFSRRSVYPFAIALFGSAASAVIAVAATALFKMGSVDMIIVGAIVPLLPGLAMTHSIRDAIQGDLISASARITEALLTAVGIAAGVGLVFSVYIRFGGVL